MIPFYEIPSLAIPGTRASIHAFGVLVAIGILVGVGQVVRRGRQLGLDPYPVSSMCSWGIGFGFVVSHLFDVIAYQPEALRQDPWILLNPASGLSSFGGFLGLLLGLAIWTQRNHAPTWPYLDAAVYGGTTGWLFGRLGCFTAHDHPGRVTDFFLAVNFGAHPPGGVRHDLGLYEAIFTLGLVIADRLLIRKARPAGFYIALTAVCYGPTRFLFDFLRDGDIRYGGLTPAQYGALALTVAGALLARRVARATPVPAAPPAAPAA